jgi:hypothetical protein
MGQMNGAAEGSGLVGQQVREGALVILRDAPAWRMSEARWAVVAEAVDGLVTALAVDDAAAFQETFYDLELAGPLRATSYGPVPTVAAPERVLERINELVRSLSLRRIGTGSTLGGARTGQDGR